MDRVDETGRAVISFRTGRSATPSVWSAAQSDAPLLGVARSTLIASGADLKVVQSILGHASAAMTMDLYGHVLSDARSAQWR